MVKAMIGILMLLKYSLAPHCTSIKSGKIMMIELCVAERTVFARREINNEKPLTRRQAEIAAKRVFQYMENVMDSTNRKKIDCIPMAKNKGKGITAKNFPKKSSLEDTGASNNSSSELRSRSPAKLSAVNGEAIGAIMTPSKSMI